MFAVITPDIITSITVFNKYLINITKMIIISDLSFPFVHVITEGFGLFPASFAFSEVTSMISAKDTVGPTPAHIPLIGTQPGCLPDYKEQEEIYHCLPRERKWCKWTHAALIIPQQSYH